MADLPRHFAPKLTATARTGTVSLSLLIAVMLSFAGCRSDARFVKNGPSRSASPVSRADETRKSATKTADNSRSDPSATAKLAKSAPPEKPRKFLPDLFRKNRESQTVPLPTTPVSDDLPVTISPVEDFQ